ncbi:hypothetical protein IQ266_22670 [filamentous cyanobacterium LEGE 11480]|uniref:Uncharacterized protein n=1 Tax=Romeriopsis navalis LEGE 11480 TaxID=2777977 RepID=A0A928VRR3_9CYAN|nr:hypothetical protein [Romeriopsis navalis]MBE9032547.1 hypothetical protein [Romeriopsis navalis LEGE 11480]
MTIPPAFARKIFALLLGVLALLIPSLLLFDVIRTETLVPIPHLLLMSTIGLAIGGAIYTPRKWWQSAITWAFFGTSSLIGLWIGIFGILILLKPWNL